MKSLLFRLFPTLLLAVSFANNSFAHGSIVADADLCIIQVGYFQAHFKIYLPTEKKHTEFCEDLPTGGEAVFVMEYIHGELGEVLMDFRIIHNVTGQGIYTRMDDVEKISNIEQFTVFYQPAEQHSDVFMALHNFDEQGEYLGIITARDSASGETYSAVFPFEVGYTRFGYLPLFIVLLLLVQGLYWFIARKRDHIEDEHD